MNSSIRPNWKIVGLALLLGVVVLAAASYGARDFSMIFKNDNNVAINGFDSVAYFAQEKAVKGNKKFSHDWHGAKWLFSSSENRDMFVKNPGKYAPQYGGYCAWGLAEKNTLFPIDPNAWNMKDGKLYLNHSKDIQKKWKKDSNGFVTKADSNWDAKLSKHYPGMMKGMKHGKSKSIKSHESMKESGAKTLTTNEKMLRGDKMGY